ncbi:arginyl-tRNA--protein transferase 1 [Phtheirospermum japonicum]|uniref:Arginyl-tRNA--protein transferase n=1 Tax=Phtheirospermum japonicum TaxID=374723 RepID=A0A830D7X8_9LAMI|nr:arginyl-tRNA--protein transferase 1 [Phtheirospermum japonicum]
MAEAKKMRSEASTSGSGGGGNNGRLESVVVDVGRRKSTCGYCKSGARTSISHGLWAHSLTVDDYQALLDRGWRRSGCFLYKPDMEKTCCPSYTIRLKASDFVPSKEQGRVSRRMKRFLDGTLDAKETDKLSDKLHTSESVGNNQDTIASVIDCKETDKSEEITRFLSDKIDYAVQLCVKSGKFSSDVHLPKPSVKKVLPAKKKLKAENSEELAFSSNIAFQVAASLKRSKKDVDLSPKTVAEILTSLIESCGLSVRACNGHINFYSAIKQIDSVEVQRIVKPNNDRHFKKNSEDHQNQRRRFEIRLKKSSFDDEEYSLYRKYQLKVHNDTPDHVSESSYKRFLVDTPLVHVPPGGDHASPPCGFGSFHQQYVVDGKLIAVGVVDILPKCLSSKYLFWDPDFAFLSLGKYSALEEISKMRYKAAYRPSELLCPLRFQWVPYDIAKPLLDRRKYVVLSDYATLQNGEPLPLDVGVSQMDEQQNEFVDEASNDVMVNEDEMELDSDCSDDESDSESSGEASVALEGVNPGNVLIGVRGARLRYKDLRHAFEPGQRKFIESQLQRYVRVVGTELSEQMAYSLG